METLKNKVKNSLLEIIYFFESSYGLPHEMIIEDINNYNLLEQILFIDNFCKRHKKYSIKNNISIL